MYTLGFMFRIKAQYIKIEATNRVKCDPINGPKYHPSSQPHFGLGAWQEEISKIRKYKTGTRY
jgi:hypothetical protein